MNRNGVRQKSESVSDSPRNTQSKHEGIASGKVLYRPDLQPGLFAQVSIYEGGCARRFLFMGTISIT
jgi:hypothetical protein